MSDFDRNDLPLEMQDIIENTVDPDEYHLGEGAESGFLEDINALQHNIDAALVVDGFLDNIERSVDPARSVEREEPEKETAEMEGPEL